MTVSSKVCRDTILALLSEAREAGIQRLTRTALVKYVYLLDVYVAESNAGKTKWTDLEWVFLHYGPYSAALVGCLDELESQSFIEKEERSASDRDFILYSLGERVGRSSLTSIGVDTNVAIRLKQALRDFAYSLPKLLEYVYFATTPMERAVPNQRLSFEKCRTVSYKEEIRPLKLVSPDKRQIARMKQLIEGIRKRNIAAHREQLPSVISDAHYAAALEGESWEIEEPIGPFIATIEYERQKRDAGE